MSSSTHLRGALFLALVGLVACGGARSALEESTAPGVSVSSEAGPNESTAPGVSAGSDAGACTGGSITFSLHLSGFDPQAVTCLSAPGSCFSWLGITGPGGAPLLIDTPCGPGDAVCAPGMCGNADCDCGPLATTTANMTRTWDGTLYTTVREAASCPAPGPFLCYQPGCTPPGQYAATMCAGSLQRFGAGAPPNGFNCSDLTAAPQCTTVTFQWPPAAEGTVVTGTLEMSGAGGG